jgi:Tol biopolymer transport system component
VETGRDGHLVIPDVDNGLWTPDGSRLIYREAGSQTRLMERTVATGETRELLAHERMNPLDISPDGKIFMYFTNQKMLYHRRIDRSAINGPPQLFLEAQGNIRHARFSPDGKWIVYTEIGPPPRIYVQPFPSGGLRRQISAAGGVDPVWRGDGKEILYRWNDTLFSVRVDISGRELKTSEPEPLFPVKTPPTVVSSELTGVSRDGSRILFAQAMDESYPQTVYVMTSWNNKR